MYKLGSGGMHSNGNGLLNANCRGTGSQRIVVAIITNVCNLKDHYFTNLLVS